MSAKAAVPAAEANRKFSELLRGVRDGHAYVITSHGKPVARIAPFGKDDRSERLRAAARKLLFDRLAMQDVVDIGRSTRDEWHDRERR
jgi:prevent-host-death family protein